MFDGCLFVSPRVLIDFWDFEEKKEMFFAKATNDRTKRKRGTPTVRFCTALSANPPYYSKFHRRDPSSSTSRGGWVNSCLTPPHAPSPAALLRRALLALVALVDELGKSLVGLAVAHQPQA